MNKGEKKSNFIILDNNSTIKHGFTGFDYEEQMK